MTPERWQLVKELFEQAVVLPASERDSFLNMHCAQDAELWREAASLIASHEQAGTGFLKTPAADLTAAAPAIARERRIGPYEVLGTIGQGGMGEVYRASRADGQYKKEVAVKLVRGGLNSASVLERFRNERQILASLDHPNIARLLDGGTTDDGAPYLVMELIDGNRVDSYCDAHQLSVTGRLQLFRQICSAVQYAHQHLVIHRDIKPSNILVTGQGLPKLLDFGIAKILDPAGNVETTLARPMTPEYASPEQIRGEPITTASDVYSLGVVLYHLLTGRSPYPVDTRSSLDVARAVCDTDPARPSTVVLKPQLTDDGKDFETGSAKEAILVPEGSPAKLKRRLAGDLDNIVLMALRKEPQRRYPSVEQLSDDIGRHLSALPVRASKGSWAYNSRKFVIRHKAGVAATCAVVLALMAGIGATLREARIAHRQAEIATMESARAKRRFDDVRKLSDSLIFDIHDSIQNLPGATPARKLLLDRALEYLDSVSKDAAGDPDLQRELAWGYQRLAVVQGNPTESNLGDLPAALASDRKALALFQAVAAANPENVIDQLNVAMMHRILAYSSLTDATGREDLEQAMAITDRLLRQGTNDPRVRSERSVEYQNLGLMQDAAGNRADAVASYRRNQELKLDILRTNPDYRKIRRSLGMASVMLGTALARMGSRDDGLSMLDRGIALYESVPKGDDDVNVQRELAISRQKRGDIILMNGDWRSALRIYTGAQEILVSMAKADPENIMLQLDVAALQYQRGRALGAGGNFGEALVNLQSAAGLFQKFGAIRSADDEPRGASDIYIWIGDAYSATGNTRNGIAYYRKAMTELESHPDALLDDDVRCTLATSYVKLADASMRQGNLDDASGAYRKALMVVDAASAAARKDIPALYVIAQAHAGLSQAAAVQAQKALTPEERRRLQDLARQEQMSSSETWRQIPHPARTSPSGFLVSLSQPH